MLCVVDCKDVDTFCKVVYRNGYASVVADLLHYERAVGGVDAYGIVGHRGADVETVGCRNREDSDVGVYSHIVYRSLFLVDFNRDVHKLDFTLLCGAYHG